MTKDIALPESWFDDHQREATPQNPLAPVAWPDLKEIPAPDYLIKSLLDQGAMSVVYGAPNSGKTFVCLDLLISIARGAEWRGKRVKQGTAIYLAAEAGHGILRRLTAYEAHHDIDPASVPFSVIPRPVDLTGDVGQLIEALRPHNPAIIAIDTLNRVIGDHDENSPQGMSAFIRAVDAIRAALGCHVLVVHHSGKDASRGARGHSSLLGATDTELAVLNDEDGRRIKVAKQRDGATGEEIFFALHALDVGTDSDGDPITSCVVVEGFKPEKQDHHPLSKVPVLMSSFHDVAEEMTCGLAAHRDKWMEAAIDAGISASADPANRKRTFRKNLAAAIDKGLVFEVEDFPGWYRTAGEIEAERAEGRNG
ncbi:helicase RepA family protein [Thalassospira sp.]|uniref:AAA family ATPase n=1 Tax=Thalassospira sp. TaxID=1912094 RepID=UPI001B2B086E|nr:helicase RepA family protein [Thalassospira sp.]MBO6807272.1 AAA family ATPase [Thalassospira sp.]MBO6841679.1 AAA family ATPase [Thalassospira sp.]